jgi:hypothetical protein
MINVTAEYPLSEKYGSRGLLVQIIYCDHASHCFCLFGIPMLSELVCPECASRTNSGG